MSHNFNGPHHKIWTSASTARACRIVTPGTSRPLEEHGYALVSLLALMTVIAIFALAAAPSIRQQAQREREQEAIFRGEQVAEAIRVYYSYQQRLGKVGVPGLPTSMDQLLEGVPSGTKKLQVLRASAGRDPLTVSGEWKLIRPGPTSTQMTDFTRAIMLYSENIRPATRDPQLQSQEQYMAPAVFPGSGSGLIGSSAGADDDYTGPFIGAASRSKNNSVIYYYGIGHHDGWVFTPLFR